MHHVELGESRGEMEKDKTPIIWSDRKGRGENLSLE